MTFYILSCIILLFACFARMPLFVRVASVYFLFIGTFGSALVNSSSMKLDHDIMKLLSINAALIIAFMIVAMMMVKRQSLINIENLPRFQFVHLALLFIFVPVAYSIIMVGLSNIALSDFKSIRVSVLNHDVPFVFGVARSALDRVPVLLFAYFLINKGWLIKSYNTSRFYIGVIIFTLVVLSLTDFSKGSLFMLFIYWFISKVALGSTDVCSPRVVQSSLKALLSVHVIILGNLLFLALIVIFSMYGYSNVIEGILLRLSVGELSGLVHLSEMSLEPICCNLSYLSSVGGRFWGVNGMSLGEIVYFDIRPWHLGVRYGNTPIFSFIESAYAIGTIGSVILTFFQYFFALVIYLYLRPQGNLNQKYFEVAMTILFLSLFSVGANNMFSIFVLISPKVFVGLIVISILTHKIKFPRFKLRLV